MVGDHKALGLGHGLLARLDFRVIKLFHPAAVQTHHVVVVLAFVELVNGFATLKVVAAEDARLLEQVDSDVLPSESDFAGRLVGPQAVGKLPALQASEEDLKKFAPAATATRTDSPTSPAALPRSYPPLEPAVR